MSDRVELSTLDKWVHGIDPQDSVLSAAQYSLCSRLASVQLYFPMAAASKKPRAEDLHQLRVATRRSLTALELYDSELPSKRTNSLHRMLKKIQRGAGDVRDLDVLIKRYRNENIPDSEPIIAKLKKHRSKARERLGTLFERLQSKERFAKCIEKLLKKLKSTQSPEPLNLWVKRSWSQRLDRFFEAADAEMKDFDALHRFRIRSKALRYELELLAPVFVAEPLKEVYAWFEQVQNHLGKINDHVVARRMFHQWDVQGGRWSKSHDLTHLCERVDRFSASPQMLRLLVDT